MKKKECRKETVKVNPENLDKEVTMEALMHLKRITEKYVEDVESMFHTYKVEFSALETGLTLGLSVAEHPVIALAMGSSSGIRVNMLKLLDCVTEDLNG